MVFPGQRARGSVGFGMLKSQPGLLRDGDALHLPRFGVSNQVERRG